MPNIITGLILSIGRVSGETAPILFTVAAYFLPKLPTSVFDQVMALPYHFICYIYKRDKHSRITRNGLWHCCNFNFNCLDIKYYRQHYPQIFNQEIQNELIYHV